MTFFHLVANPQIEYIVNQWASHNNLSCSSGTDVIIFFDCTDI